MNADLFNRLLQQPALLKNISTEELEQLTYQYPWFGAGQFLLAAKMKQADHASTNKQIQKAVLFSTQPLWFNLQLKRFEKQEEEMIVQQPQTSTDFVHELKQSAPDLQPETEEEKMANDTDAALDAEAMIEAEERNEQYSAAITDDVLNAHAVVETEASKEKEALIKEAGIEANPQAIIETGLVKEEKNIVDLSAADDQPVFTFEPFYTVDYFASQGIKLQEDKLGDDKLGQQVKTFTQWLRSMKKIYVEEKKELDINLEQAVVTMATESNQLTEVITETMADVLIKQGKLSQAIDLYRKLSLLHPEKSVYFASRIDELKL